jgi:hypothetical protein
MIKIGDENKRENRKIMYTNKTKSWFLEKNQ